MNTLVMVVVMLLMASEGWAGEKWSGGSVTNRQIVPTDCLETLVQAMRAMDEFVTLTRPHENENPWGVTGIMRCDSTFPSHCSPDQWLDEEILDIERRRLILKAQREWDQRKEKALKQWNEAKACWYKP